MAIENIEPDETDLYIAAHIVLKPCPFCGRDPLVFNKVNHRPEFGTTPVYRSIVACTGCDADVGYNATTKEEARTKAIERWQTRT